MTDVMPEVVDMDLVVDGAGAKPAGWCRAWSVPRSCSSRPRAEFRAPTGSLTASAG